MSNHLQIKTKQIQETFKKEPNYRKGVKMGGVKAYESKTY